MSSSRKLAQLAIGLAVLALIAPYLFNALVAPRLSGDFTVSQGASDRTRAAFTFGVIDWALAAAAFAVSLVLYRKVRRTGLPAARGPGDTAGKKAGRGAVALLWITAVLAALFTIRLGWVLFWTAVVQQMAAR